MGPESLFRRAAARIALTVAVLSAVVVALELLGVLPRTAIGSLVSAFGLTAGIAVLLPGARVRERERELKRSQGALLNACAEPIIATTVDGRVESWNAAAERLYGYSAAEILGRNISLVIPIEAHEAAVQMRAEVVGQCARRVFEGQRVRKDGSTFMGSTTLSPIMARDGVAVVGVSAVTHDVTRQYDAEQALKQAHAAERRLRRALEAGNAAGRAVSAALADLPRAGIYGVLREVVEQARAITDVATAAIGLGEDPDEPYAPWVEVDGAGAADAQRKPAPRAGRLASDRPDLARALSTPVMFRGARVGTLVLAPRAAEFPSDVAVALMAQLLADRAGAAIEVARAYEREAAERAWLDAVLDQMPEPIVLVGPDGVIRRRNRVAKSLSSPQTGVYDQYGNQVMYDVRQPDGRPMPPALWPFVHVIRTRQAVQGKELIVRTAAGLDVPLLVNAAPVYDRADLLVGFVIAAQDITPIKRIERLRAEWTALVAHDLRQPVSAIQLSVAALRRRGAADVEAADGPHVAATERIQRASDRLQRMIGDLLNDAQLQADRLTLELQTADLNAIVGRAVADLTASAGTRRVALELPATPQLVRVDAARITQVLGNLLSNAVKYSTEDSKVQVVIRRALGEAIVTVSNRGPGISADDLPHVFERFRRTTAARSSRVPGLGLGLAIARGLVEAHGGRIWAESAENEATTFAFALPLAPDRTSPVAPFAPLRSYA